MARVELHNKWRHYACAIVLLFGILVSLLRWLMFGASLRPPHINGSKTVQFSDIPYTDVSDPLHCVALVSRGQWLGQPGENWQPDGCMLHIYSSKDASKCLAGQSSVFIGDSITRNLFFAFMHLVDPSLPEEVLDGKKHADYHHISSNGTSFKFLWDPFLNSSQSMDYINAASSSVNESPLFLLILGSGLWYLRYPESSGSLAQWQANTKNIIKDLHVNTPAKNVVMLPVEKVLPSKLSLERARMLKTVDIDAMNAELRLHLSSLPVNPKLEQSSASVTFPIAFNDMLSSSETIDGLHYSKTTVVSQANILLNRICNDFLPKKYPLDKTCCRSYPSPSLMQRMVLGLLIGFGPFVFLVRRIRSPSSIIVKYLLSPHHTLHATIVGGCVGLLFLADRTNMFLKEQKQYEPLLFAAAILFTLTVGLLKLETVKDQSFLNRLQTDEWKGWMQVIILIYHYFGASKVSGIYNPVRVLVASYIFMSGYGHCSFYLKKADYGFLRVAQVLTRLNLLTVMLAYTMNTDYFDYYFAPMVSFWFLVIYGTMICGAHLNDRLWFLMVKLLASSGMVYTFINTPLLFGSFLDILHTYANVSWSKREVAFRLNLDLWIVYIGMLCAIVYLKLKEMKFSDRSFWEKVRNTGTAFSCFGLCWFMYFQLSQPSKFTYNKWHPFISWIPIVSFVILRNSTPFLRSKYSTFFAFIGTCSLETFIIQFHFWLAADTKGVLLVIPGTNWRPINIVFTTISFVWISHRVAISTTHLTDWICGISKEFSSRNTTSDPTSTLMPSNTANFTALNSPRPTDSHPGPWTESSSTSGGALVLNNGIKGLHLDIRWRFALLFFVLWSLNILWQS